MLLIPQFKKLIHRDKGSDGDYDGRKKLRAIKEFTFIYHLVDPRSPLENVVEEERREKSFQYAELEESNIDGSVIDAQMEYEYLLENSSPSLPLLRSAKRTNKKLITYFDNIDFSLVDTKGQLVHSPMQHIKNVSMLRIPVHENTVKFEEIVLNELKEQKGTRGKTELGDKEQGGSKRKWVEGGKVVEKEPTEPAEVVKAETERLNQKAPSFMVFAQMNEDLQKDEDL